MYLEPKINIRSPKFAQSIRVKIQNSKVYTLKYNLFLAKSLTKIRQITNNEWIKSKNYREIKLNSSRKRIFIVINIYGLSSSI